VIRLFPENLAVFLLEPAHGGLHLCADRSAGNLVIGDLERRALRELCGTQTRRENNQQSQEQIVSGGHGASVFRGKHTRYIETVAFFTSPGGCMDWIDTGRMFGEMVDTFWAEDFSQKERADALERSVPDGMSS
jgi:hypothetical protein